MEDQNPSTGPELPSNVDALTSLSEHAAETPPQPPNWGCEEFRRTIAWMAERWPALARDAIHPLLDSMIENRKDRRRMVRIRPTGWFMPRKEATRWAMLQTPINVRQMMAIEMGYAAFNIMTAKKPNGGFWDVLYYIGLVQLILSICVLGFFLALTFPYDMNLSDEWGIALILMIYSILGGIVQMMAGKRNAVENFKLMQMSMDRYRSTLMRAAGMDPTRGRGGQVVLIGCLALPAFFFLTYGMFLIVPLWMLLAPLVAFVLAFMPRPVPDPSKLAAKIQKTRPDLEQAYLKLQKKLESYAPVE